MSLLFRNREERAYSAGYPMGGGFGATGYFASSSGEIVSEATAQQVSTVIACVKLIADTVAASPLYIEDASGRHAIEEFLPTPCVGLTWFEFLHSLITSELFNGNAFTYVDRDVRSGKPLSVTPLNPALVGAIVPPSAIAPKYTYNGQSVADGALVHTRWFPVPQQVMGLSPLKAGNGAIGLAMAMDRHISQWYADGAIPASVITIDGQWDSEQKAVFRESWMARHNKSRTPAILQNAKWQSINDSAEDMQLAQSREAVRAEICRIYGVPTSRLDINSGSSMTYSNSEMDDLRFYKHPILPLVRRLEAAFSPVLGPLLSSSGRIYLDLEHVLRADSLTRWRVHQIEASIAAASPNEVRASEGRPAYDGGDDFYMALAGATVNGGLPLGMDDDPTTPSKAV